jgi:hypothetical protein
MVWITLGTPRELILLISSRVMVACTQYKSSVRKKAWRTHLLCIPGHLLSLPVLWVLDGPCNVGPAS